MVTQRTSTVRFEGKRAEGGGKAKWTLLSSPGASEAAVLKLQYPDGSPLRPEEVGSIDQISVDQGFTDPATILKTVGISVGSLVLGCYITSELVDLDRYADILVAFEDAFMNSDVDQAFLQLARLEEFAGSPRAIAAIVVSVGAIVGPAAYAGYALSKREIRLRITMQNGEIYQVKCPEYVGGFLVGAYKAVTAGVVGESPVPDDSNEAQTNEEVVTPQAEAPASA